ASSAIANSTHPAARRVGDIDLTTISPKECPGKVQPHGQAPSEVRHTIAILTGVWAILFAVAAIPAVRPPWETSVPVREVENGLLLSEPITSFVTPYVSFIRPSDGSAFDRDARVTIVAGTGAIESAADLTRRTLIAVAALDTTAHQFAPSQSMRAA